MVENLRDIGINDVGYWIDQNTYVIEFDDSNKFAKALSKVSKNSEFEEVSSPVTMGILKQSYKKDNYEYSFEININEDEYKLICTDEGN